jgi:hypothetical protein
MYDDRWEEENYLQVLDAERDYSLSDVLQIKKHKKG